MAPVERACALTACGVALARLQATNASVSAHIWGAPAECMGPKGDAQPPTPSPGLGRLQADLGMVLLHHAGEVGSCLCNRLRQAASSCAQCQTVCQRQDLVRLWRCLERCMLWRRVPEWGHFQSRASSTGDSLEFHLT
jgi:hypothetical protein